MDDKVEIKSNKPDGFSEETLKITQLFERLSSEDKEKALEFLCKLGNDN